jgi:hypothetical protein
MTHVYHTEEVVIPLNPNELRGYQRIKQTATYLAEHLPDDIMDNVDENYIHVMFTVYGASK